MHSGMEMNAATMHSGMEMNALNFVAKTSKLKVTVEYNMLQRAVYRRRHTLRDGSHGARSL